MSDRIDGAMTVGELRKALEGVPDDVPIAHADEGWYSEVSVARIAHVRPYSDDRFLGIGEETDAEHGNPWFLVGGL